MASPLHIHINTKSPLRIAEDTHKILETLTNTILPSDETERANYIIRGDDLRCMVLLRSLNHADTMSIFWRILGIERIKILYECSTKIESVYDDEPEVVPVTLLWTTYRCSQNVAYAFQSLLQSGIQVVDFFFLLYAASKDLSPNYKKYLTRRKISVKKMLVSLDTFAWHDMVLKAWWFAFLEMMSTIMRQMSLSLDDFTMIKLASTEDITDMLHMLEDTAFFDTDDMTASEDDLAIAPEDSYESDVMDQEESKDKKKSNKKPLKDKDKQMSVEIFGTDLTDEAKNNRLDPVIGRSKEIEQLTYTLLRKTKSNPLLIGEAGVGKTAIVEWLAHAIVANAVPDRLKGKRIMMLDVSGMVAGTKYRGDFEARFKAVMEEAADPTNNIILFIDEIHTIIGAGGAAGTDDAAQLIKPLLARGKIKLIAATTYDEYQQHIEKDAALKRRFQEIHVDEPTIEDTTTILLWLKKHFEEFHNVQISDESITSAISLAQRYIMNKHFPDKAIDILDEASARKSTLNGKLDTDDEYVKISKQISANQKQMEKCIAEQDYFMAADLKLKDKVLKDKLRTLRSSKSTPLHLRPMVDKEDIWRVLADKTGVPTQVVTESEIDKLQRLKAHLDGKILWQDEAVSAVVKTIQRSRLSVVEKNRPIASFLFLGPSGVGKTYLAKLIAKEYFGDEKAMIRVDMSEFMESYTVSKLIWSAPGYVGYESGGMLTEQVRRKPYSVILLDEIEKANRDVLNVLLQILDEGQIKDNKWRVISFKSTIIVMTSNLGAEEFAKKKASIWFSSDAEIDAFSDKDWDKVTEKVQEHVKDFISPELQNRIDYSIIFKPLTKDLMAKIFKSKLDEFLTIRQSKTGVTVPEFDEDKIGAIIDKIYNPQFGARPIEKYIYDTIEPELIDQVMNK